MSSPKFSQNSVASTSLFALRIVSDDDPARHTKILDMEVKYLVDNFSDPLVYPQWQKKMAEVGRGECPHGTEVMNRVMCLMLLKGQSTT